MAIVTEMNAVAHGQLVCFVLKKKVSISTNQKSCNPGETLRFTVNSTRNSVVYLLTIDEGIHRSQHGFDINIDDVSLRLFL